LQIDWAAAAGLAAVRLLPVNDTSSSPAHNAADLNPFTPISGFALHPLFISVPDAVPAEMPELHDECDYLREVCFSLAAYLVDRHSINHNF
jgi:4-alpha-glucanotransferase